MHVSRRHFLLGSASSLAILATAPADAWTHGVASLFNGGKTQGQSATVSVSQDFPFLNFCLTATGWQGTDTFNNQNAIDPSWLSAGGYPLASALQAHSVSSFGVVLGVTLPALSSYSGGVGGNGNLRLVWTVTGAGATDQTNWSIGINSVTPVSSGVISGTGSVSGSTSTGNGTFYYIFTPVNFNNGPGYNLNLTYPNNSPSNTAQLTSVALVYDGADYMSWSNGGIFSRAYLAKIALGGFGVWRFMDWLQINNSNVTTWATRKSVGYPTYGDDEYRANLSFGLVSTTASAATVNAAISNISVTGTTATVTTSSAHGITSGQHFIANILNVSPGDYNVFFTPCVSTGTSTFTYTVSNGIPAYVSGGNFWAQIYDYTITVPGTYAWSNSVQGNYAGGAPVDKMTAHVRFDQDAIWVNNDQNTGTLTVNSITPLTFGWPSNPLPNGAAVCIFDGGGGAVGGTNQQVTYYVVNATSSTFQVALTSGGAAINASSAGSKSGVTRLATLNINSSGAFPIRSYLGNPIQDFNSLPAATARGTSVQLWGTVTFDAVLSCWMMAGGTNDQIRGGLMNNIPPETCFALCKQAGMHPHWSIPGPALDPMTDYVTSLATYCKTNNPGWMVPRFEPGNEIWNNTAITEWGEGKGFVYWGLVSDPHNWYGKILSTMGQDCAAVYGLGNLGTTYEVMCGIKSDDLTPTAGGQDPRLSSAQWISAGTPTQSGYTVSAASGWTSAALPATYNSPTMRGDPAEYTNAWQYFQVNGGTVTSAPAGGSAAMTNLNNFVDTLGGASAPSNNAYWATRFANQKSWAAGFSVNKMFAYEGGYSPDLMNGPGASNDWDSGITGASKASQCVLTLPTATGNDLGPGAKTTSGNIAAIGMCLHISGISGGMTQLNTTQGVFPGEPRITFTIGSSTITFNNSLVVNQGIVFPLIPSAVHGALPDNITPNIPYFIVSASSTTFQIATTKGGTPITFTSAAGASSISNVAWWAGWMVNAINVGSDPTKVQIDCDSSAFTTYTSGGSAAYAGSMQMCNWFRCATLAFASDLSAQLKTNYDNFISAGGLFPSQYQFAGAFGGSIWNVLTPDIYTSTPTQEFSMIQAYNGH